MAGDVHHLAASASKPPTTAVLCHAINELWAASDLDGVIAAANALLAKLAPEARLVRNGDEALDEAGRDSATNAVITSIAPTSTVTDNVVTYEVRAALDDPPARLRIGQTASLEVVLDEADDALLVPSSAITTTGTSSTVDVLVDGRVPLGSGLSSSAALECAVAVAVADLAGSSGDAGALPDAGALTRRELAEACVEAENKVAGANTGGMDQSISLCGKAGHAMLLDCADFSMEHVPWAIGDDGWDLLVRDDR